MKKEKITRKRDYGKKINWKLILWGAGVVLLIILSVIFFSSLPEPGNNGGEKKTYEVIELYFDESSTDPDNLNEVHVANVFYKNETFRLEILESEILRYYAPEMASLIKGEIQKSFDEVRMKTNLTITYENMENGALVMYAEEITKADERYIYAIEDYLSGMFRAELK